MARYGLFLAGLITLIFGAMVFHAVTNITDSDISALKRFEYENGTIPARAGDIVALSPDGSSADLICDFDLTREQVLIENIEARYVNDLGRHLPDFIAVLKALGFAAGEPSDRTAQDSILFVGQVSALKDVRPSALGHACECAMARRLMHGERVCTARSALSRNNSGFAQAISFATYSNFVSREKFEACNLTYPEELAEAEPKRCAGSTNLPWDTRIRRLLNLIEERPIENPSRVTAGMSASALR